jgi:DNA-binding LacI/PurR family transcriptional regulator
MKGASTIEDVARQAGVAISTVSHVINGTKIRERADKTGR